MNSKVWIQCPECGLLYKERKWAEKCEEWCKRYKSCNLEIMKHAIRKGGEEMLKAKSFANALAVVMGIFYVVCALWVAVAPGFFRGIAQTWFHGYDLSVISAAPITFGSFLVGLITAVVITWLFGYLFAWVYNRIAK